MMRIDRRTVFIVLTLLGVAGCTARRAHYELSPVEQFFGNRAAVTRHLGDVLQRPASPTRGSSIAVAWLEQTRTTRRLETKLQDDFVAKIRRSYPGRVVPVSPVQVPVDRSTADPLVAYRIAAADLQTDTLVAIATRSDEYVDTNLLGVLYLGLVTIPFVPASDVVVETAAEACAIDVRSGAVFDCVRATDVAKRPFTAIFQAEKHRRELVGEALERAVEKLPDAMSLAIREAALRARTTTSITAGQRYPTMTD